jgi:hypothetical protein
VGAGETSPTRAKAEPIEQEESANDSPLKHIYQDGDKKDAHKADGGNGCGKLKNRRRSLASSNF